jgi:hypothetical protein
MRNEDYTTEAVGAQARAYAYLLGELDDAERFRFERDYLADREAYDVYLAAQDELIESYLEGELSPARRERFDRHFLITEERRERLRLIRDLNASALPPSVALAPQPDRESLSVLDPEAGASLVSLLRTLFGRPRRRLAFAGMIAAVAFVFFLTWRLIPERTETPDELVATASPTGRSESGEAPGLAPTAPPPPTVARPNTAEHLPQTASAPTARTSRQASPRVSYALTLAPMSLRDAGGDETHVLRLPRAAEGTLRLRLLLEAVGDAAKVRAEVSTAEGVRVYAGSGIPVRRQGGAFVTLKLRTASLDEGDFTIKLTSPTAEGTSSVTRYAFRVTRR